VRSRGGGPPGDGGGQEVPVPGVAASGRDHEKRMDGQKAGSRPAEEEQADKRERAAGGSPIPRRVRTLSGTGNHAPPPWGM
jgi:hypothetical protein